MSSKCGGLGLRDPLLYFYAAEITTLRDKDDICYKYFPFMNNSFNDIENNNKINYDGIKRYDLNGDLFDDYKNDTLDVNYNVNNYFNYENESELQFWIDS